MCASEIAIAPPPHGLAPIQFELAINLATANRESLRQHIKCVAHYLLRVLAKLPIRIWIVVCVPATLEAFGIDGPIKELRRDTQRPNLIASVPSSADLVALAIHVVGPMTSNALNRAF